VDAQDRGRPGLLVLTQGEDVEDVGALELVERWDVVAERQGRGLDRGRPRADVVDAEAVAGGEHDRALDGVLELADVARPRLLLEPPDRLGRELDPAAMGAGRGLVGKVAREWGDVGTARPQR